MPYPEVVILGSEETKPLAGRIGPYRIERRLGAGGMGVVYLCRDDAGALAAVKVIKPEFAADKGFRARLRREVAAARRVPRFCTARVIGARLSEEPLYIATEYIDGPTLDVAVLERGRFSGEALERLAAGIAIALRAIHEHGVIHRDLKPSNVMVSSLGPRVIDFGIARLDDVDTVLTEAGTLVGTLAYMAPEQLLGGPLTTAVDVFAWAGVVTYAATGRPPFGADAEVRRRILAGEPRVGGLTGPVRDLVLAAFEKGAAERPSAADRVNELSRRAPTVTTRMMETAAVSPPSRLATGDPGDTKKFGWPSRRADPDRWKYRRRQSDETQTPPAPPTRSMPSPNKGGRRKPVLVLLAAAAALAAIYPLSIWLDSGDGRPAAVPPSPRVSLVKTDHSGEVDHVAISRLNGRTVAVSTSTDNKMSIWDLAAGRRTGKPIVGRLFGPGTAVATGTMNGRAIAVSAGGLYLQVWDLATRKQIGKTLGGRRPIYSVAIGRQGRRTVAITGGNGLDVRVWDLAAGRQVRTLPAEGSSSILSLDTGRIGSVAIGTYRGRTLAVAGSDDDRVLAWELNTGRQVCRDKLASVSNSNNVESVALGAAAGEVIAVAGYRNGKVATWDLGHCRLMTAGPEHEGAVHAVAAGMWNGHPIAVSAGEDRTVRVWDPAGGRQLIEPMTDHADEVFALAVGTLNGRTIVVSGGGDSRHVGGGDNALRVWPLGTA